MSHFTVAIISEDPNQIMTLLAPFQESTTDDYPNEYLEFTEDEDSDIDPVTNKRGYWENPNARWDWYDIGGRWSGLIKTKSGGKVDQCQIKDADFSPNQEKYNHALRFWEINVDGDLLNPEESKNSYFCPYKPKYYTERYANKESYAKYEAAFSTHAFITPDGKWHEKGNMGWWGADDATADSIKNYLVAFEDTLKAANPEHYITIVDCHI